MYSYIYLFLLNDHTFFLCRYVRTDSCFWDFPWELRGTSLTPPPKKIPTCPQPPGLRRAHPIAYTHSNRPCFDTPMFLHPIYPPHSYIWSSHTCMCSQGRGEGRDIKRFLTSTTLHVCVHVFVCSTETWTFSHTHHSRGKNECWWYCFRCKERTFLCTTICSCRKFAFPHTEQLNGSYKAFIQYDAAFSFCPSHCHHKKQTLQGIFD